MLGQDVLEAVAIAIAADKDVGIWIDLVTRNAGMMVACDKKVVEFTRFIYLPAASMTDQWKAAKAWDWNSLRCNIELWRAAIDNGWSTVLNVVTADGGRATFKAQCR